MTKLAQSTILVVDDESMIREIIAEELALEGATVIEAEDGNSALELVRCTKFDAVVSDIRMPGGNGTQLLDGIRDLCTHQPVVMFVSAFSDLTLADAYARGAEAVFSKPFDLKVILERISSLLRPASHRLADAAGTTPTMRFGGRFSSLEAAISQKKVAFGRGGLVLFDQSEPHVGSPCSIDLRFDSGEILNIDGEGVVRWCKKGAAAGEPSKIAIELTYLSDANREQLLDHLKLDKIRAYLPNTP